MQAFSARLGLKKLPATSATSVLAQLRWLSQEVPAGADRSPSGLTAAKEGAKFNLGQLERLVCPLSKATLRWDEEASELICDEVGVAYPVVDRIAHLIPEEGRVMGSSHPGAAPGAFPTRPS